MHKYTLNAATGIIHIYEGLHYNPTYEVAKGREDDQLISCNDLPSKCNAKDLGSHSDMNDAHEMAKGHHDNPKFCLKCFGFRGVILNRRSRNA